MHMYKENQFTRVWSIIRSKDFSRRDLLTASAHPLHLDGGALTNRKAWSWRFVLGNGAKKIVGFHYIGIAHKFCQLYLFQVSLSLCSSFWSAMIAYLLGWDSIYNKKTGIYWVRYLFLVSKSCPNSWYLRARIYELLLFIKQTFIKQ